MEYNTEGSPMLEERLNEMVEKVDNLLNYLAWIGFTIHQANHEQNENCEDQWYQCDDIVCKSIQLTLADEGKNIKDCPRGFVNIQT